MIGLCVLQCLTLLGLVHWWTDLEGGFLRPAATLILASFVGAALGLAISARSSSTESAIALLPVVLLPVIALGGGIRAIYKMPEPARSISYVVPSRWALEANLVNEARSRPCGALAGAAVWTDCPHGGRGVDVAAMQFPRAVSEREGERHPGPPTGDQSLRHSFAMSMAILGSMLGVLVGSVLTFLRMRDLN
jgi:hypothetical protein